MSDLKNCPMCGGKARIAMQSGGSIDGAPIQEYCVRCTMCHIRTEWHVQISGGAERATEIWNKRDLQEKTKNTVIPLKNQLRQLLNYVDEMHHCKGKINSEDRLKLDILLSQAFSVANELHMEYPHIFGGP